MDAFAIRDNQRNPIFEDGYLSFVCEESDNIIRVDPNQFDFSGSEPFLMEHGGITYKLYLYNNPNETDSEIDPVVLKNDNMQENGSGSGGDGEARSKQIHCTTEKQMWNKENTETVLELYQKMGDSISLTFHTEQEIWEKISEELQYRGILFSPEQVEKRIKTIETKCEIKLKQAQKTQLETIKQEPENDKSLKNRVVANNAQASESMISMEQHVTDHLVIKKEPLLLAKPKNSQEVEETAHNPELHFGFCKSNQRQRLSQNRKKIEWNEESTELLLDLYQKYSPELGRVGKFASKTQLWCKISEDFKSRGYCFNPTQVQSRWRNLSVRRNINKQYLKKNSVNLADCKANENEHSKKGNHNDLAYDESKVMPTKEEREHVYSNHHKIEDSKLNSNKDSSKAVWTEEQAELLIDVYKEITQKHNLLKFGSRNYLWKKVAQELRNRGQDFTPQQVHSKWRSLQRSLKTRLEKLKKIKLHRVPSNTSDRFDPGPKPPMLDHVQISTQPEAKPFVLPLEVVLKDSSDDDSESLPQMSCNVIAPDDVKSISESLIKLTSIKENYYKDKLLLKDKKLKAFEERTIEIRRTNDLLKQFLKK